MSYVACTTKVCLRMLTDEGFVRADPSNWPQPTLDGGVLLFEEHRLLAHLMLYLRVLKNTKVKNFFTPG